MRIHIMAIALIYLDALPYFQIFVNNFLVTFMVIYIMWFEVYKLRNYRFFQVLNEIFVCFINYHMIVFAYAEQGRMEHSRTVMGWTAIATVVVNIILNFLNVIYHSAPVIYRRLKTKYLTYKRDGLRRKLAERAALEKANAPKIALIEDTPVLKKMKPIVRRQPKKKVEKKEPMLQQIESLDSFDYWQYAQNHEVPPEPQDYLVEAKLRRVDDL